MPQTAETPALRADALRAGDTRGLGLHSTRNGALWMLLIGSRFTLFRIESEIGYPDRDLGTRCGVKSVPDLRFLTSP